jgi:hypothetical protein
MTNKLRNAISGELSKEKTFRLMLAISALTMFVLSAGAPGATGH